MRTDDKEHAINQLEADRDLWKYRYEQLKAEARHADEDEIKGLRYAVEYQTNHVACLKEIIASWKDRIKQLEQELELLKTDGHSARIIEEQRQKIYGQSDELTELYDQLKSYKEEIEQLKEDPGPDWISRESHDGCTRPLTVQIEQLERDVKEYTTLYREYKDRYEFTLAEATHADIEQSKELRVRVNGLINELECERDRALVRANRLEEWLTEYRDQLKKENVYHKNTGIINAINELLND